MTSSKIEFRGYKDYLESIKFLSCSYQFIGNVEGKGIRSFIPRKLQQRNKK